MSETPSTPLEAAVTEYAAAVQAIADFFHDHPGDAYSPALEPLFRRDRAAREAYAQALEASGHPAPVGLLRY